MSQHGMAQPSLQHAKHYGGLTALMVVCALGASGCHIMENIDLAKTSEPPHYPHEFEAPVSYGYFPTMWRPWPGAESVPGNTARPQEEEVQQGTADTTEPLPEPSNESAPGSDLGPGMENVFDLPPNADQGMPGEQPEGMRQEEPSEAPDTTLPDELIPPESEAVPADESAAPAAEPAGEVMPDELIPPDEGQEASPKTTKFRGNWDRNRHQPMLRKGP